jgi:hypothetical protein
MMKPASKMFFLCGYLGGIGAAICFAMVGVVAAVILDEAHGHDEASALIPLVGFGFAVPAYIVAIVVYYMLVYKMWSVIQRGPIRPQTTPGMAVGLCFVPIFNLYWNFVAIHGWTKDYNRYVRRAELRAPQMPEGLALAMCIMPVVACVAGSLAFLVQVILTAIFIPQACDGINAIIAAETYRHYYDDELSDTSEPTQGAPAPPAGGPDDTRFREKPLR